MKPSKEQKFYAKIGLLAILVLIFQFWFWPWLYNVTNAGSEWATHDVSICLTAGVLMLINFIVSIGAFITSVDNHV